MGISIYYCKSHPETIYTSGAAPILCPTCRAPIVDVDTGQRKGVQVMCSSRDGSSVVFGRCSSGDCEFVQTRDAKGRTTGEVHFPPGTISWDPGDAV